MKKDLSKVNISPMCTGIPSKNDISECRGMSDPFFFAFNVLNDKPKLMVAHGIVFTSLVLHQDSICHLLTEERDPRVEQLIKFIKANFLTDKKKG